MNKTEPMNFKIDLSQVIFKPYHTGPGYVNGVRIWRPGIHDVQLQIAEQLGRPLTDQESTDSMKTILNGFGKEQFNMTFCK